jgi:hypothetical protein
VLQRAASNPLANGSFRDPKCAGHFLDCETIYPSSIPFVHSPILDDLDRRRKPLELNLS